MANLHDKKPVGQDQCNDPSPSSGGGTLEQSTSVLVSDATARGETKSSQKMSVTIDEHTNVDDAQQEDSVSARAEASSQSEKEIPSATAHTNEQQISTLRGVAPSEKPNVVQNAFDRIRPRRPPAEIATITIGNKTVTSVVGSGPSKKRDLSSTGFAASSRQTKRRIHTPSRPNIFAQSLKSFAAPGTQTTEDSGGESEKDVSDDEAASEVSEQEQPVEDPEISLHEGDVYAGAEDDAPDRLEQEDAHETAEDFDEEYVDEAQKKAQEEAKVQELIREAEEKAEVPAENNDHRAKYLTKGQQARRDSTAHLVGKINGSISRIQTQMETLRRKLQSYARKVAMERDEGVSSQRQQSSEEQLSLTVSKDDFAKMRIVGQFNLGFILATRAAEDADGTASSASAKDELFIIDQHASDEKYNFERLQAETVVQNQRLVRPKTLDLTAVEEEVIIENRAALEKNGFVVEVDESGDEPIGRRCKLVSLPLSKEVVFDVRDLEELVVLLADSPTATTTTDRDGSSSMYIPRPSKVRKMFAMRACRSSIMIGKTLTVKQMEKVVRHMGTIDKPWNCPHGRPTMRHLMTLGEWNEYDEYVGEGDDRDVWSRFFDWRAEEEAEDNEEEEGSEN